jgi:hypothetical protein
MTSRNKLMEIVAAYVSPDEKVVALMNGNRLCDVRLEGLVHLGIVGAHFVDKAFRGGSWVPGMWAVTNKSLIYVSNPMQAKGQARGLDVKIPLSSILWVQEHGRLLRRLYDMMHRGGVLRILAFRSEADKVIPLLRAAVADASSNAR